MGVILSFPESPTTAVVGVPTTFSAQLFCIGNCSTAQQTQQVCFSDITSAIIDPECQDLTIGGASAEYSITFLVDGDQQEISSDSQYGYFFTDVSPSGGTPTSNPTVTPTNAPVTDAPVPTVTPTNAPVTDAPVPTVTPTNAPVTDAPVPTVTPTNAPVTDAPVPTVTPTNAPVTDAPVPTVTPTTNPTGTPTGPPGVTLCTPTAPYIPSGCISSGTSRTVSTTQELISALEDEISDIALADGTYIAPTDVLNKDGNSVGFAVNTSCVNIKAANVGKAIITCQGGPTAFGITVYSENVYINGLVLTACAVGAYVEANAVVTFDGLLITENFNNIHLGSGIHTISTSMVSILNTEVSSSIGYAGIYCLSACDLTNVHVYNISGGGIQVRWGSELLVFCSNISDNYGSGIYSGDGSNTVVVSSNLDDNYGSWFGAGVWVSGGSLTVQQSDISGNSARYGGGVFAEQGASVNIGGSKITGNSDNNGVSDLTFPLIGQYNIIDTVFSSNSTATPYCCNGVVKTSFTNERCSTYDPQAGCTTSN